ncbi:AraC family transcriptional regulator [Gracilibacillus dipsosauri]|uniref:HTH araC/xylS-type domain-containing protein n=1 Tax=Gracilibacillus dipsosauri TaxID=178340 RepID=A0A317L2C1_9BACI|nr:AraC family transcriptional regulator [Gracilibacillus dipsosauri]PWU67939.1 hypothetical protein DLJ74_12590 [Gracilibacillus dipsosauri]
MVDKVNVSLRNQSFYLDYSRGYENSQDMQHYHLHQDYEILYLLEGEKILFMNGGKFTVKKDHIMFIDKNVMHKTIVNDHKYQRIVMNFRDGFLLKEDQALIMSLFKQGPLMLSIRNQQHLPFILEKMLKEYFLNKQDSYRYLQLLLSQFLTECKRLLNEQTPSLEQEHVHPSSEIIDDLIAYINEHFHQEITLSVLAESFYLHEQSISKLFKKSIGCSFIEYLNAVRITEAKRLLTETTMKINQIMKRAGYTNHVHFWRIFKKLTGLSPNEYREQEISKINRTI